MNPILVDVLRGNAIESSHCGALAVLDADGGVVASLGDIDRPIFPRSAVKVLQALPLVASGAAERLGLTDAELALACASHNGEELHVQTAARMLAKAGNLYGPGQNLAKAQGLISQICRGHLTGQPLSIYVSLDTLRDYFFAPDCADLIVDGLARLRQEQPTSRPGAVTKILASQRAITIGTVIGEMRRIFKRSPRIVLGASPISALQPRDLSLRSRVWPDLDRRSLTPLPAGIAATAADLQRKLQAGWAESGFRV